MLLSGLWEAAYYSKNCYYVSNVSKLGLMFVDVLGIQHILEDMFRLNTIKFHILYSSKIT